MADGICDSSYCRRSLFAHCDHAERRSRAGGGCRSAYALASSVAGARRTRIWRISGLSRSWPRDVSPRKSGAMDPSRRTRRLVHASEGKRVFRSDAHDERRIENAPGRTEAICGTREAGRPRPGFGLARVCLRTGPFVAAPILRSHQRDRVRPRSTTLLLRDTSKRFTARYDATASGTSASLLCTPRAGRAAVAFGLPACPTLV